jgi:hypothetical protein
MLYEAAVPVMGEAAAPTLGRPLPRLSSVVASGVVRLEICAGQAFVQNEAIQHPK